MNKSTAIHSSNVPKKYRYFKPLESKNKEWLKTYETIKQLINDTDIIIIIYGKHGTGKTQIACSICIYYSMNDKIAYYTTMMEMIINILDSQAKGKIKDITEFYCKKDLLIIDAFELRKGSDFENRILNYIIDRRYMDMKNTIIISNEPKSKLIESLGSGIVSRTQESGKTFDFSWNSFRGVRDEIT